MRMLNAMRMCSKRGVSAVAAALAFRLAKLSAILSSSRFVTRTARLPGMMEMIPRSGFGCGRLLEARPVQLSATSAESTF